MVQLSLATGINASTPQRFQLVPQPRPYTGNPVSGGLGGVAGLVNPLLFGSIRPNNSLLPFNQQNAVNQSVVDTVYNSYGSRVSLIQLNQYAGMNGYGPLSNTVNNLLFRTLTIGGVEPNPPQIGDPYGQRGEAVGNRYGVSYEATLFGSQVGQTFPGDLLKTP